MALRAVVDHPKFARLKTILRLNKSCTLGYLEALWHFCGRYTPQGNIGKYSNEDIEAWLEWDGEPGTLIAGLVEAEWVLLDPRHRLIAWHCGWWSGLSRRARRRQAVNAAGGEASPDLRRKICRRDGYRCKQCWSSDDITLDHIIPVSKGGETIEDNLQVLCRTCNSRKRDSVVIQ